MRLHHLFGHDREANDRAQSINFLIITKDKLK